MVRIKVSIFEFINEIFLIGMYLYILFECFFVYFEYLILDYLFF